MLGKPEVIGVDIGQYSVKVARVKQSSKTFTANYLSYETIPVEARAKRDRDTISKIVATALKKLKVSKGTPVVHINTGDVITREVEVDKSLRGDALEGAVEVALSEGLPFGIDQVYFDFDEVPDEQGMRFAAVVRRDVADEKVALLGNLPKTFNAPQVDVDSFAFSRVLEYVVNNDPKLSPDEAIMLIDIGYARSRFYVCRGGNLIFSREQEVGGNTVNEIITDVFDIDAQSAENRKLSQGFGNEYHELVLNPYVHTFTERFNLAIDFYEANSATNQPIKNVFLTGGGSRLAGLVNALNNACSSYDIKQLDLTSFIKQSSKQQGDALYQSGINHALAIGLAMDGTK